MPGLALLLALPYPAEPRRAAPCHASPSPALPCRALPGLALLHASVDQFGWITLRRRADGVAMPNFLQRRDSVVTDTPRARAASELL